MKQSKIEEMIDESFNRLIDTMIKFPENSYHINFEEIFFKGKADLIHKLEEIISQKDEEIEYQKEKRNNQKQELAILNEKQKEMNKLINIVNSYKGMYKKSQKENKEKDKQIDLMAKYINYLSDELVQTTGKNELEFCRRKSCKDSNYSCEQCIKKYFERKVNE